MKFNRPTQATIHTSDGEPITVVNMSDWYWEFLEKHGQVRFAVSPPLKTLWLDDMPTIENFPTVTVEAIAIKHRGNAFFMLVTQDDVNALMMKSSILPGQRAAFQEEYKRAFAHGFMHALSKMGNL